MAPERPGPEDEPVPVALSVNTFHNHPATVLSIPNTTLLQIQEGDGASEDRSEKGSEDDDLTSLTWLQDKNLLKGINLRTNGTEVQESPTSDYVDDSASERGSTCSSVNSCGSTTPPTNVPNSKSKHPHHVPYNPKIHTTSKPPYSFSCLIFMAIEDSPAQALPVKEIYNWILEHFPFYRNAPTGWKNSVRHNLSLNKCFCKVDKSPTLGKGSLWMVDPPYRCNLMQSLQKAPYHPCSSFDKAYSKRPPSPVRELPKPAPATRVNGSSRLPDPELFPYLARRLAAVEGSDPLDDVHAAAAMLQLKHGSRLTLPSGDCQKKVDTQDYQTSRGTKRKAQTEMTDDAMLVTSSPSEDHTYSSAEPSTTTTVNSDPISPDEAFAEGSDSNSSWNTTFHLDDVVDIEEQRKIAEGADALLNLAGIKTHHSPQVEEPKKPPAAPKRTNWLRKTPPAKHRRTESDVTKVKNRWKPGLMTENNNVVEKEKKRSAYQPPTKTRRKSAGLTRAGLAKHLGKFKR